MDEFNSNNVPNEPVSPDSVSGVEPAKKRKKAPIIAGIAAGVVALGAGGCVAAYNLSDSFKNTIKLNFSKSENYYSWVMEKNSSDFASNAKKSYQDSLGQLSDGAKASFSLKYEISDDVRQLALDNIGTEDAGFADMINNFESAKIGIDAKTAEKLFSGSVYADLNDERLTSMDIAMDMSNYDVFARIPDLTEKWIGIDIPDDEISEITGDESFTAMQEMLSDPEKLISADELEELIGRYSAAYANSVSDVEIEKKADVDIAGLDVTYTVASVEMDDKVAEEVATAIVETAQDDDLLKEIICERLGAASEDEYDDAMDEALSDMSFEDVDAVIETYIDGEGSIKGFRFEADDDEMLILFGEDGDKSAAEFSFTENGEDLFLIEANYTEDSNKYSGNVDVSIDNVTISVDVKDYEVVNEERGYFNGEFTIDIPDTDPIAVDFESDGDSQIISSEVVINDMNIGRFSLEISAEEGADPEIPSKDDAFMIDENSTPDFTQYVDQTSVEGFISDLLKKLGVDETTAADLARYYADDLYNPVSYDDYDYDYDDDYDYDYDYDDDDDYDFDYSSSDQYANDAVEAQDGQAYVEVYDIPFNAYYLGYNDDTMAYNAVLADITKDGTYKVSVTADTDGYRQWNDELPSGVDCLALVIEGVPGIGDAEVKIDTLTFTMEDGKKQTFEMTGEDQGVGYDDYYSSYLYFGDEGDPYDLSSIETWVAVEIEFTVKGL